MDDGALLRVRRKWLQAGGLDTDGTVRADLSVPKSMGGPGKPNTATPEHLFAAGYAACFCGAMEYVARQRKMDATGLAVTAEGVETGAQADALIALGCVRQQGHLYARALPAAEFESFLVQRLAEDYVSLEAPRGGWDTGELDDE